MLRVRVFTVALVAGLLGVPLLAFAQQNIQPTGTPTWVPRKVVATPVPLTPLEAEAKELGEKLSKIDLVVWKTVREQWDDAEACLKSVDAHLEASKAMVHDLILESKVINCTLEEGSNRRRIRLTSDEARKTFILGYHDAIEGLRALKVEFETKPEAQKVLKETRTRQRQWQRGICEALETVKPPVIVPKPQAQPRPDAQQPVSN